MTVTSSEVAIWPNVVGVNAWWPLTASDEFGGTAMCRYGSEPTPTTDPAVGASGGARPGGDGLRCSWPTCPMSDLEDAEVMV